MIHTKLFEIADATNKSIPYGGVQKPIAKFIVSIIPNVIGDIPKETAIGSKIGVSIIVAGILSINIPTSNKKILINRRTMKPLLLTDSINEAILAGICSIVKSAAKAVDKPTIKVVAPFTTIASLKAMYATFKV